MNESYEQILADVLAQDGDVDSRPSTSAKAALRLLAFARHPLYLEELLDGIAISISDSEHWRDSKINLVGLLRLLPGMVQLSPEPDWTALRSAPSRTYLVLFEHFSVQEFFTGTYIHDSPARSFTLDPIESHRALTEACLTYLYRTYVEPLDERVIPFAEYAWLYWRYHLNYGEPVDDMSRAKERRKTSDEFQRWNPERCRRWCAKRVAEGLRITGVAARLDAAGHLPFFLPFDMDADDGPHLEYLPIRSDEFRLLNIVRPRFPESLLYGHLTTHSIHDPPPYNALGYAWGGFLESPQGLHGFLVNGAQVRMPNTLRPFLRSISHSTRFPQFSIWTDAICIDQTNNNEKVHQVALMLKIYTSATELIISLGAAPTEHEGCLLDALKAVCSTIELQPSQRPSNLSQLRSRQQIPFMEPVEIILEFLDRSWFSRLWAVPDTFRPDVARPPQLTFIFDDGKAVTALEMEALFLNEHEVCDHLDEIMPRPRTAIPSIQALHLSPAWARSSCLWRLTERYKTGLPIGVHQILYATRFHICTMPADRLYALYYSFQHVDTTLQLQVDYRKPHGESAESLHSYLARKHGILGLLAETSMRSVESWYKHPTIWGSNFIASSMEQFVPLSFRNMYTVEESDFNAGGDDPGPQPESGDFSEVEAWLVGQIQNVHPESQYNMQDALDPEVITRYGAGRLVATLSGPVQHALVPECAHCGDSVHILKGFRLPYVLRSSEVSRSRSSYVGEA